MRDHSEWTWASHRLAADDYFSVMIVRISLLVGITTRLRPRPLLRFTFTSASTL